MTFSRHYNSEGFPFPSYVICMSKEKANAKPVFPSRAGKRSYFSGATQHFCSCHCCRLFCVKCRFRERREERDELVWSDWWVGGGEGQRQTLLQHSLDAERPVHTHTSTPTYAYLNSGACGHARHVALMQMHSTRRPCLREDLIMVTPISE